MLVQTQRSVGRTRSGPRRGAQHGAPNSAPGRAGRGAGTRPAAAGCAGPGPWAETVAGGGPGPFGTKGFWAARLAGPLVPLEPFGTKGKEPFGTKGPLWFQREAAQNPLEQSRLCPAQGPGLGQEAAQDPLEGWNPTACRGGSAPEAFTRGLRAADGRPAASGAGAGGGHLTSCRRPRPGGRGTPVSGHA